MEFRNIFIAAVCTLFVGKCSNVLALDALTITTASTVALTTVYPTTPTTSINLTQPTTLNPNNTEISGSSLNGEEDEDYDDYDDEMESLEGNQTNGVFSLSEDPDDIRFLLFRDPINVNTSEELIFQDTNSIDQSGFNPSQMTVFIIHGFWSNSSSGMPVVIKKAYLEAGVPYNIIVVDWGKLSRPEPSDGLFARLAYFRIVRTNLPIVYTRVADFIQFLVDNNYATLERIHVVGHSLGAHVSGGAGHVIANNSQNEGRKLARITGLDPAGPLFQGIRLQRRLRGGDADFVDIYHTAAGTLGNVIRRGGDADFFPNGGHHQPGCVDFGQPIGFEADFGSCSHSFVSLIYAASITKNFTACQCDPAMLDYIAGQICPGDCSVSVLAGERCPPTARGQFYFETSEDPFEDVDSEITGNGGNTENKLYS